MPDTILRRDEIPLRADLLGWLMALLVVVEIESREFGQAAIYGDLDVARQERQRPPTMLVRL